MVYVAVQVVQKMTFIARTYVKRKGCCAALQFDMGVDAYRRSPWFPGGCYSAGVSIYPPIQVQVFERNMCV